MLEFRLIPRFYRRSPLFRTCEFPEKFCILAVYAMDCKGVLGGWCGRFPYWLGRHEGVRQLQLSN